MERDRSHSGLTRAPWHLRIRALRWLLGAVGSVPILATITFACGYMIVRLSLPDLDGQVLATPLRAEVTVERDSLGVPTLKARNRPDLAIATGFVHAQDRFFQMDLQRRLAAGELAELVGPAAVKNDRTLRQHQFVRTADMVLDQASPAERELLEAYAAGVNLGLQQLGARPWEYLLLGFAPRPWQARDSILVAFAMYIDLNDASGERELANAALRSALPAEVFAALYPLGSEWDAPIDGGTWRLPPLPSPQTFDLRQGATLAAAGTPDPVPIAMEQMGDSFTGSNSWAIAGHLTADGGALLANDMHLGLQVPNIWYRARLIVADGDAGRSRDLIGVTLPGLPALIVGSNGKVAWGFTNTHGDWTDLVKVRLDPVDGRRYLADGVSRPFEEAQEIIRIRGEVPETLAIKRTVWGPVTSVDATGTPLALAWTAHRPEATNLHMLELETATTVEEALAIANTAGAPVQNFVAADAAGNIGWTLLGQIPVREGYDSRFPAEWNSATTGWTRWRRPEEYPRIVNPLSGRLWTANARTIDAARWLELAGPGAYALGARAGQIRDGLLSLKSPTAWDMHALQLDDRALFLARWRDLLLDTVSPGSHEGYPDRQAARSLVEGWSGRATPDDAGYRIVRAFRRTVLTSTFAPFVAGVREHHPNLQFDPGQQFEGAVWQLLSERPIHLLDPQFGSWEEALVAWFDATIEELTATCGNLSACTWGKENTLAMRHPLSQAVPLLAMLVDMPETALPGDAHMPRVQSPRQGASERMVVSPGREQDGYFHMPGGQSSHPLSPFFRAGHAAWEQGEPLPLLPGTVVHTLRLVKGH